MTTTEERIKGFLRDQWVSAFKGGDPCEWPEDLRVREMPRVGEEVCDG